MTIFPEYERQLHELSRARVTASQARTRDGGGRSWSWTPRGMPVVVSVVVVVLIAGGALWTLGHSLTPRTPASAPRRITDRPARGIRALQQSLEILRRPQVPSDLTSPELRPRPRRELGLVRSGARRATVTQNGMGVFVIPVDDRRTSIPTELPNIARVALTVGDAADPFTLADIQSGRASFSETTRSVTLTLVLVPDGVSRVTITSRVGSTAQRTSTAVVGNVALFTGTLAQSGAHNMLWYGPGGARVPIRHLANPAPDYPVNARGETYGTEPSAVTPGPAPDLIAATGRRLHGRGHITGYLLSRQLNRASCGSVTSPRQATECDQQTLGHPTKIPLYARDGTTVIGTFTIGSG